MNVARGFACLAIMAVLMPGATAKERPQVDVVVGSAAPELERFAARELCDYLAKLYSIQAYPARDLSTGSKAVFLIGSPETNATVKQATSGKAFPKVSDQGIVLRRTELEGRPALIVGGGSPRATLWAVYELAERWGVRYLVDRDVLPADPGEFSISDLDVVMEPVFRIRAHPTIQDYAPSGESWGIADFRVLIDQLAKMKFNRANIYAFAYQPYLEWEYKGIKRLSATLWYGYSYPITDDMVGRELFGDRPVFWNPDLPVKPNSPELVAAGVRQVHLLMEHAHRRGMECAVGAPALDFPPEFAPLIEDARPHQDLTVAPGPDTPLRDAGLFALATAVIRATVNTYPEADLVTVWIPEFRQWGEHYEQAWKEFDSKYGVGRSYSLDQALAAAEERERHRWHPSAKRPVYQVKSDLAGLDFLDRLLKDSELLKGTRRPEMRFMVHDMVEELFPIVNQILTQRMESGGMPDKCLSRYLERRERLKQLPKSFTMDLTFDDDVMGVVPQLTTGDVHKLLGDLRQNGLAGFVARERFPGDHDTELAYLSRAAWDPAATPESVARSQLRVVCGEACAEEMLQVLEGVESATHLMERSPQVRAFAYAVPGMLMNHHWKPASWTDEVEEVRRAYQHALDAARRAQEKSSGGGRPYVDFWVGRLEFSVAYAEAVAAVRRGGVAEAAKDYTGALRQAETALASLRKGLEAYSRGARTRTDLGAIAVVNEHGCRALETKIAELRKAQARP